MNGDLPSLLRFTPVREKTGGGVLTFSTFDCRSTVGEGPLAGRSFAELAVGDLDRFGGQRCRLLHDLGLGFELRLSGEDAAGGLNLIRPGEDAEGKPVPGPGAAAVILASRPGARFFWGRRRDLTTESFRTLLIQGDFALALAERSPEGFSTLLAPPGFPFALGAGISHLEVSVVARERGRLSGGGIHRLGGALKSNPVPANRLFTEGRGGIEGGNAVTWLFAQTFAAGARLDLREEWKEKRDVVARGSFALFTLTAGSALCRAGSETESLSAGDTVLVPAQVERLALNPGPEGATIIKTWVPDHAREIESPLAERGFSRREIEGLYGFFGKDAL